MTTTQHRTPPHPDTDPATLTGAPAKIFEALTAQPGSTSAELATFAGVGRSTAGKALAFLEAQGMAVREPGDRTPAHATPDRWRRATPTTPDTPHPNGDQITLNAELEDSTTPPPATTDEHTSTAKDHTTPEISDTPAAQDTEANPNRQENTRQEQSRGGSTTTEEHENDTQNTPPGPSMETAPTDTVDETTAEAHHMPETTVTAPPVTRPGRLQPGALREMVIAHLKANPDSTYTATGISRAIEKSSGAIANALVKLTAQGITRHVSDAPRRYQYATPDDAPVTISPNLS